VIVVDTNIIAYFLIVGDRTAQTRQLWQTEPGWYLPALWRHEFLNVLASYTSHSRVPVADMTGIWQYANQLFAATTGEVDMESALELSVVHKISAYDAQFVTLAQQLGTVLVTEDKLLLKRFPDSTVSLSQAVR
jgi:predicted nucleic acid-binding protein